MLLENIFCASLILFCIMMVVVVVASPFALSSKKPCEMAILLPLMLSGLVTIITAIMWIWRAWS